MNSPTRNTQWHKAICNKIQQLCPYSEATGFSYYLTQTMYAVLPEPNININIKSAKTFELQGFTFLLLSPFYTFRPCTKLMQPRLVSQLNAQTKLLSALHQDSGKNANKPNPKSQLLRLLTGHIIMQWCTWNHWELQVFRNHSPAPSWLDQTHNYSTNYSTTFPLMFSFELQSAWVFLWHTGCTDWWGAHTWRVSF